MVQTTSTTGGPATTTTTAWPPTYDCPNRLACGLCLILNRDCPKMVYRVTPTWDYDQVTCNAQK